MRLTIASLFDVRENLHGGQDIRDSAGRFVGETRPNLWGSVDVRDRDGNVVLEGRPGLDGDTFWRTGVQSERGDD